MFSGPIILFNFNIIKICSRRKSLHLFKYEIQKEVLAPKRMMRVIVRSDSSLSHSIICINDSSEQRPVYVWATICFSFAFIGNHLCSQKGGILHFFLAICIHQRKKAFTWYSKTSHVTLSAYTVWFPAALWHSDSLVLSALVLSSSFLSTLSGRKIHYLNTSALSLICRGVKRRLMPSLTRICRV